jgi:Na+/H+ antiporter NhaD/arsenite permease-like protein
MVVIIYAIVAMRRFARKAAQAIQNRKDRPDLADNSIEASYERMLNRDIYLHISEVSVAMIGVCLTGVSILNVEQDINDANTYVDDLLAIDSFVFLTSYLLSYWVVRVMTKGDSPKERLRQRNMQRVGDIANAVFLIGMIFLAIVCGSIVIQGDYSAAIFPSN